MSPNAEDFAKLINVSVKSRDNLSLQQQIKNVSEQIEKLNLNPSFLEIGAKLNDFVKVQSKFTDLITKRYPNISPQISTNALIYSSFSTFLNVDLLLSLINSIQKLKGYDEIKEKSLPQEVIETLTTDPEVKKKIPISQLFALLVFLFELITFCTSQVQRAEDQKQHTEDRKRQDVYSEQLTEVNRKLDIFLEYQFNENELKRTVEDPEDDVTKIPIFEPGESG